MQTPPSILRQIAQLSDMTITELKSLWVEIYGSMPPIPARSYLEKRIAYQLQARALSEKDSSLIKKNAQRIHEIGLATQKNKTKADNVPVPGTILRRLYNDVEYEVHVTQDGTFQFEQRTYGSLSKIAREITGTRWSGPLFFGLRRPTKKGRKSS